MAHQIVSSSDSFRGGVDILRSLPNGHQHVAGKADHERAGAELISSVNLLQFLGGTSVPLQAAPDGEDGTMTGVRLSLSPGDALYAQGSPGMYVYLLEAGLVQCRRHGDGFGLPDTVSYAGPGEWIGLYDHQGLRRESVDAATHTSLLALPCSELHALSASSPMIDELLARRSSMALKRDWRVAYSLRDLPPCARTLSSLIHLVRLIDPKIETNPNDVTLRVSLDIAMLGQWLGLPLSELRRCLMHLQSCGALHGDNARIMVLTPRVLFSASRSLRDPLTC